MSKGCVENLMSALTQSPHFIFQSKNDFVESYTISQVYFYGIGCKDFFIE